MTEIETIEKETDDHVSKSLGVWPLHKRIDLLDKRTAVLQETLEERLDASWSGVTLSFAKHLGKQGARIGAMEERVLHAWPPASDIEVSGSTGSKATRRAIIPCSASTTCRTVLAGERRWRNRKADQVRLWLYALAGVAGAGLVIDVLTEVIWGG